MSKTIVKIKTWFCPECGYHQDFEPTPELMLRHFGRSSDDCPSCGRARIKQESRPEKKCVVTIMGEEDIEPEIQEIEKEITERQKDGREIDDLPDIATAAKKNAYRAERKKEIWKAINEARKLEDK